MEIRLIGGDLPSAADIGGDDRTAQGQGFKLGQAEALVCAR